jgi:hypothetical protein
VSNRKAAVLVLLGLCSASISIAAFPQSATATTVAKFLIKIDSSANNSEVAETVAGLSLSNCKVGQANRFGLDEIIAWMECNEVSDVNRAILDNIATTQNIKEITVFSITKRD